MFEKDDGCGVVGCAAPGSVPHSALVGTQEYT
jgi:hypothetical protein